MDLNGESSRDWHMWYGQLCGADFVVTFEWLMISGGQQQCDWNRMALTWLVYFAIWIPHDNVRHGWRKEIGKVEWQPLSVSLEISNEKIQWVREKNYFNFTLNRVLSFHLLKIRTPIPIEKWLMTALNKQSNHGFTCRCCFLSPPMCVMPNNVRSFSAQ